MWTLPNLHTLIVTEKGAACICYLALVPEETKLPFEARESFQVTCGCEVIFPCTEQQKPMILDCSISPESEGSLGRKNSPTCTIHPHVQREILQCEKL